MINDMGITVHETAPDADDLLTNEENTADEVAAEEAAAALAAVENEVGRTTDPVRMYMREMGTVELLTREGEIAIAKRIEEGIRDVLRALAFFPGTVDFLLDSYTHCVSEDKLSDLLVGYLDPTEEVPAATQPGDAAPEIDEDDEDEQKGPDPIEAKKRFSALKRHYNKYQKIFDEKGPNSKELTAYAPKLAEAYSCFKLTPKYFDQMVEMAKDAHSLSRKHERAIMSVVVKDCGVPRDLFRSEYLDKELSVTWINKFSKAKKDYSGRIEKSREEILRHQKRLKNLVKELGLTIKELRAINRQVSLGRS